MIIIHSRWLTRSRTTNATAVTLRMNQTIMVIRTSISIPIFHFALDSCVQDRHDVRVTDWASWREPDLVNDNNVGYAYWHWRANQDVAVAFDGCHFAMCAFWAVWCFAEVLALAERTAGWLVEFESVVTAQSTPKNTNCTCIFIIQSLMF